MRCATPQSFWVSPSPGGGSLVEVVGLSLGVDGAACTGSEYVVVTQTEFDQATVSPFRLSNDEAASIASAVLLVWAIAWGVRVLVRVLRDSDSPAEE